MSGNVAPRIVRDGLVFDLDAANDRSYVSGSTVWRDLTPSLITGSLINGPAFNSANGGSIQLDGSNDYVLSARPRQILTGGSITVCMWIKWTTIGTTSSTIQVLVDNNHYSTIPQGFVIQDRPDVSKKIQWVVYPQTGANVTGATSSFQVGDGTWRHVVGTHQSNQTNLYIDGKLNGSYTGDSMATVQQNISLGYWQYSAVLSQSGRYLNGNISNVLIYDRALSATEVLQNYNAQRGRFGL